MYKIFIDGAEGTTGLRIKDRLVNRNEFKVISLSDDDRKNPIKRKEMINASDITVLCLPDDAARESVSFVENPNVKIVDASTAHRVDSGFVYGFSQLSQTHKQAIINSNRVAVPGCHASGIIALIYPLIKNKIINDDLLISATSLTGYSGGGKGMIKQYETTNIDAPKAYALGQSHKHLKEIVKISGLKNTPVFCPIVCNFYNGMHVSIPLHSHNLNGISSVKGLAAFYKEYYADDKLVSYFEQASDAMITANKLANKNNMEISICGNDERMTLNAVYDNLGKGASGAAVECINLMIGLDAHIDLI